jgi:uncharacterized protein (TIGR03032 family)
LYLLNSGIGEFGWVDIATGAFTPIAFCPGYARGLAFVDDYAIIGLSEPRGNRTFGGLPLEGTLEKHNADARCGLLVVDLKSGDIKEWVRIEGVVTEIFDVAFLNGIERPSAIGLKGQEISKVINIDA